jgi:predicted TIM-barrel fold metal-dependent hydrolase
LGVNEAKQGWADLPLFDAHAHFYTNDIAHYPLSAFNTREGEEGLTRRILADPGTPERIFALWDASAVRGGAAVQYNNAYKTDNSYLLDVAEAHPQRVSAVVILDANDPTTPERVSQFAVERGIAGLRLVGFTDKDGASPWLETDAAIATLAAAEQQGVKVVLMVRLPTPDTPADPALALVARLARRFPSLAFVMDHFAWPAKFIDPQVVLTPAHRALAEHANIHFKLTSINLERFAQSGTDSAAFVRAAADVFGARRMMWGSDFGNTLRPYAEMASAAREAAALLNAGEAAAFLHDSAAALFARR